MKHFFLILALSFFSISSLATADEEKKENPFSLGLDSDFASRYLWRGQFYSDSAVWQPSACISRNHLTAGIWANMPLTDETNQGEFNEIDVEISYEYSLGLLTLNPGLVYYFYPNTSSDTTAEIGLDVFYPVKDFSIGFKQSVDFDEAHGGYFVNFYGTYSKEIFKHVNLEATLGLALASSRWNELYFGIKKAALNHASFEASLNWQINKNFYFKPHFQMMVLTLPSLRNLTEHPNPIAAGTSFGVQW